MKHNRRKAGTILLVCVMVLGIGIMLYPFAGNWMKEKRQTTVIQEYEEKVENMEDSKLQQMKEKAGEYRASHATDVEKEQETAEELPSYADILDVGEMMGYIEIPKLKVSLPIYHGTDDVTLQKGVGHMEGTSLPSGGKGTHCVLAGHSGLAGAKLFTDLDQMKEGDQFYLKVLDETLAYQVDQIQVVEPDDLRALEADPDRDLVTLLTCTPKGSNTHRLLVRGTRIPWEEEAAAPVKTRKTPGYLLGGAAAGCLLFAAAVIKLRKRARVS